MSDNTPHPYTILTSYFEPIAVEDGIAIETPRYRYSKVGYFSTSKRSPVVGMAFEYKSHFIDDIDDWDYAMGVVIGDAEEYGANPYLDLRSVRLL